jgi:hypothetical protein
VDSEAQEKYSHSGIGEWQQSEQQMIAKHKRSTHFLKFRNGSRVSNGGQPSTGVALTI